MKIDLPDYICGMKYLSLLFLALLWACSSPTNQKAEQTNASQEASDSLTSTDTIEDTVVIHVPVPDTSELERTVLDQGLVNITAVNSSIRTDIKYSTTDNFLSEDVYDSYNACYLQPEVAERLSKAQDAILRNHPDLRLLVFDCVRPRSVQYKMWEIVKGTDQQKYVAAPGGSGSMHNYGAAVDLGLVHVDSGLVDMGTPFDYFGELAQPRFEEKFVKSGDLTQAQLDNRRILRAAMLSAGFHGILSEWWHFVGFPRDEVKKKYTIVE